MPTISQFDGIRIVMYYRDHVPPHFHAIRADYEATFGIDPIAVLEGALPKSDRTKVLAWAALHQSELRANWELARGNQRLLLIDPLEE